MTFSEPIDPGSVEAAVSAVTTTGDVLGRQVEVSDGGATLSIKLTPEPLLPVDVTLSVSGLTDLAGNPAPDVSATWRLPIFVELGREPAGAGTLALGRDASVAVSSAAAAARDADGALVEASVAGGTIAVSRAGESLPELSPAGSDVAVAAGAESVFVAQSVDGRVRVHQLTGGAWQPLGEPLGASEAPATTPTISVAGDGSVLVAWAELGHVVASQWNTDSGAWERLGPEALNLAFESEPATPVGAAVDGNGRPVVLYRQGARVFTTRWANERWHHIAPPLNAARVAVATATEGGVLVAASASLTGEVIVEGHGGGERPPAATLPGGSGPTTCAFPGNPGDASFPATLSETGCYTDVATRTLVAEAIPYDVKAPLYSDGAAKRRFLIPGDGGALTFSALRMWKPPSGTIAIKEFLIEDPSGGDLVIMETRFIVLREDGTWGMYSYQWNEDGSEAFLRDETQATGVYAGHEHLFPSRQSCLDCHLVGKELLGVRTHQLNRPVVYGDTVANQVETWARAGLVTLPVGGVDALPLVGNPADITRTVEDRVRSYFDANCAHCHPPEGTLKLRYDRSLLETNMCDRIAPGNLDESTLWARVALGIPGPMPEQGLLGTDPLLTELIEAWIVGMESCP